LLQNEDEKYLHIREKLRNLPQVKASDNFMVSLQHKINLIDADSHKLSTTIHKETHERINQGTFAKFFGFQQRPWLIPSLSFTVVIFLVLTIVYFGYFNTSGTNDTQTTNTNNQTITQNNSANNNNTTNNTENKEGGTGNTSSTPAPTIGNTDSQPGNDGGLLANNDDRLGQTDSYNNRRVSNTNNKLPVNELGTFGTTNEAPNAPIESDENSGLEMNLRSGRTNEQATQIESKTTGTVKEESGNTKSAMKPFDEKSGVSVDDKKKDSSKNPRNIREVTNIGKTDLEEIMNALTGE
jgi:hypothetical protein